MGDWDLHRYLRVVWKWLWLIVLATGLAAGASFMASRSMPPTYRSSVTMMAGEDMSNPQVKQEDIAISLRMAATYAGLARRQPVLEATQKALGLPMDWRELQENHVLVVQTQGSQVFEIRVTDTLPQRAAAIANEIGRQMVLQSPTTANLQQLAERREFARGQLDVLQANIQSAEATLREKKAALEEEASARAVMDLKDEIKALELKITDWRTSYAALAASFPLRSPNTITILEPAYVPTKPVSPNVPANVLMASAVGLLLALATAFVIEYFNSSKVRSVAEASLLKLPVLGSIVYAGKRLSAQGKPVAAGEPDSPIAEAYRVVRANIQFAWGRQDPTMLLVTSPGVNEGKTTTSANLAVSFARAGKRTLLVDADLRNPSQHTLFNVAAEKGLTTLLQGGAIGPADSRKPDISSLLAPTGVPGLSLLPAGPMVADPGELLASATLEQVVDALRGAAEVVVVDSPPVLPVADTAILAALGLDTVLVLEAGRTRIQAAQEAGEILARARARVLGIVLNKAPESSITYYGYHRPGNPPKPAWTSLRILRDAWWRGVALAARARRGPAGGHASD